MAESLPPEVARVQLLDRTRYFGRYNTVFYTQLGIMHVLKSFYCDSVADFERQSVDNA